jgi:hypothetical protein
MIRIFQVFIVVGGMILFCSSILFSQTAWRGTTSTAWNTATNWTAGVPTAASTVTVGDANFTGANQPTISSAVTIASLTFNSTKASTLTLGAGGSLNVTGNVGGTWTANRTHTISIGTQSMTVNGSCTMGNAASNRYRINITISTGTMTILGSLTINTGSTFTNSSTGILNIGANLTGAGTLTCSAAGNIFIGGNNTSTGTFNRGTSTVTYNGIAGQTVRASTYYNLTINKTAGTATLAGNTTSSGTLTVSQGTLSIGASTLTASGNLAVNGTLTGTGAITFSGVNKTLDGTGSITTSGIMTVSGGAKTILATANLTLAGRISISTGITVTNSGTITTTSTLGITGASATATWVNAANSTLNIAGPLLAIGILTANASPNTVNYNSTTLAQTVKSTTYHNLTITKAGMTASLAAATTLNGNLTIVSGILNCAGFTMSIGGNVSNAGTLTAGPTVTLTGTGTTVSGTGTYTLTDLIVSGAGVTVDAATNLGIAGNLSTTGAGTLTHTTGGTGAITMIGAAKTISGTGIQLDDMNITGSVTMNNSIALTGGLNVTGTFTGAAGTTLTMSGIGKTISGAGTITLNTLSITNTVTATSSVLINGNLSGGTLTATSGTFTFNGSPSTLSGIANLFNVTVNGGTTLQLTSGSTLGIANTFTKTGSLDVSSGNSTVNYNGIGAQNVVSTTYHHLILSNGSTKTAAGAVTCNGDITIGPTTTFAAGANTHIVQGNWTNNGTFTASASTVQLTGSNDAAIGGSSVTTFNILTINKSASTNTITGSTNINVGTLNVTTGNLSMGINAVTITTTRTGNGIITGTITHTHAFAAATAYSFEGPDNTVTFATVGTVTSVSITVTIAAVGDFPFSGSINRQYAIAVTGAGYTAALRLHYLDAELNGNTESSMQLWRYNGTTWNVSGKTANDVTNNWVEQSGLTDITNRWTISDDQNAIRWNGSTSTAWNTASNWTAVQGSPTLPPSANDIIQIGTAAFTNQPTISSSVTVKNIIFGSTQAATLTIGSGGSLTLSGINGQWSANATHTVDVGAQTLTVNGNLALSDGTIGDVINLSAGNGTVSITGSLIESGGANITLGSGNVILGGDFNYSSGTYTGGTSTFTYNGSTDQIVGAVTYNNLVVNKSAGTANVNSATTVNGNLSLSTGGSLSANADLTVGGNISIGGSTILAGNNSTIGVGGNWIRTGTFTPSSSTVVFNGSGNQTIDGTAFNNVTINKSGGTASLNAAITVNGNLTQSQGTFDIAVLTTDRSSLGGTFQMGANTVLRLSGANNFPSNYSTYTLNSTSTVEYYGSLAQTVRGSITYGNLTINNSGSAATLGGAITVGGNVLIQSGSSLSTSSYTLIDQGNWTNNGSFTSATGTIQLSGTSKALSGSSSTTFNNLTVSGSYISSKDITVNSTMNITGTYTAGNTTTILIGDISNTGTFTTSGIVAFNGTQAQSIALNSGFSSTGIVNFNGTVAPTFTGSSPPQFATLNINNTGGVSPTTGWTVNGVFTVAFGAVFNGGAATQTFNSTFINNGTVTSSGTLLFSPSAATTITLTGTSFSSTGTVEFGGNGSPTIIGSTPTINALTISNTNASGVTLPAGWTIGSDINIEINATLNGGSYNYPIGGSWNNSGTFNGQTSTVTMTGTGESISGVGTTFNNLVIAPTASITANSGFNIASNLTVNGTLDATGQEITFTGNGTSTISSTSNPLTLDVLTIAKTSATTMLAQNINGISLLNVSSGTLDISTFTISEDAGLGTLQIDANATMRIGGTNTLPTFTTYDFDPASIVEYYGSGAQTITATPTYGGLLVSGSGTKTINASTILVGDLTISTGTPLSISGGVSLSVGGNWQDNGIFSAGTGTVLLGGAGKSITGATIFNDLTINGTETNTGTITVNGSLSGSGSLTQGTNSSLTINGSPVSLTSFDASTSANTVIYAGTGVQSILTTTYYDLTLSNTGIKTASSNFLVNRDLTINSGSNLTINSGVIIQVIGKVTTAGLLNNNGQLLISN